MRTADSITLLRTLLVIPVAYAILVKFSPALVVLAIAIIFLSDALDGYAAIREASRGSIGFLDYIKGEALGNSGMHRRIARLKPLLKRHARYGARIDVAGDRATEYIFWIVFIYTGIVPLFILFLIVLRHSFVDGLMGQKGTSSRMRSRFAQAIYSSPAGRSGVGALKAITFSYLSLVYMLKYPAIIGYVLVALLFAYIMIRGLAEIHDSIQKH